MRFAVLLAAGFFACAAAAAIQSPLQKWQASLADDNKDWAAAPHAILKIQDAAYLGEGESATLVGTRGKPESYRWVAGNAVNGVLSASVKGGHPVVVKDGKTYSDVEIAKSIAVDAGVDVAGAQTQVGAGVIGARIFVYNQTNAAAKAFRSKKFDLRYYDDDVWVKNNPDAEQTQALAS